MTLAILPSQNGQTDHDPGIQPFVITRLVADTVYGYLLISSETNPGYPDRGSHSRRLAVARTLGSPYHWAVFMEKLPPTAELTIETIEDFISHAGRYGQKQAESAARLMFPELAVALGRVGVKYWGS